MKKLFFSSIVFVGIIALNMIPTQKVNSQIGKPPKGMVECQCPDGSSTYYQCMISSPIPCNVTYPACPGSGTE